MHNLLAGRRDQWPFIFCLCITVFSGFPVQAEWIKAERSLVAPPGKISRLCPPPGMGARYLLGVRGTATAKSATTFNLKIVDGASGDSLLELEGEPDTSGITIKKGDELFYSASFRLFCDISCHVRADDIFNKNVKIVVNDGEPQEVDKGRSTTIFETDLECVSPRFEAPDGTILANPNGSMFCCSEDGAREPIGACCLPGECIPNMSPSECEVIGGVAGPAASTCGVLECQDLSEGACSFGEAGCFEVVPQLECDRLAGIFLGTDSRCSVVTLAIPALETIGLIGLCILLALAGVLKIRR